MIKKEIEIKIKDSIKLEEVISNEVTLVKKGTSMEGCCPFCNEEKGFSIHFTKQIYKCFKCEEGGKGAISYLMKVKKMTYPEALRFCADRKNILIEEEQGKSLPIDKPEISFRDQQLAASGISEEAQKCTLANGEKINRYEAGAIDKRGAKKQGDDMLLNFVTLDGERTSYISSITSKPKVFIRRRLKHPEKVKDKSGNPIKYLQGKGSGNHLWIPEVTRRLYLEGTQIETLYVTEGEKKADKLSNHGMPSIGLTGIHNLSFSEEMSNEFKKFIEKCGVKNVVFQLDADWLDLSSKLDKPVDGRPRTFFSAVKRFRDYFIHYTKDGIDLNIYLATLKKNENGDKGVDDLLVNSLQGEEEKLLTDFESAMKDREGNGELVTCLNISTLSEYKLMSIWYLNDVYDFAEFYKEDLKKRESFKFGKQEYSFGEDGGLIHLNPLTADEQFWTVTTTSDRNGNSKKKYTFDYQNIRVFLRNKGFGRIVLPNGKSRFVKIEGKVVREVNHIYINNFVTTYAEEIGEMEVLRMLLRGGSQYLGPDKLEKIYEVKPNFIQPGPECQFLFFKNCFVKISSDETIQGKLDELPGYIWLDQIIDSDLELHGDPLIKVVRKDGKFLVGQSKEGEECEFLKFLERASDTNWKEFFELQETETGEKKWKQIKSQHRTKEQWNDFMLGLVSKICAIGYLLHQYPKKDEARAVICMDGLESEVGTSEGGTGKSIFGKALSYVLPVVYLDGKKKNLTDDNFLYEEVDERTRVLFFDDCRVNLDFEFFFGQITTGITVNGKGVKRYSLPAPKFLFTTNHAVNGEGNSFKRRQFLVSFTNWYNEFRTPKDDFGGILFDDWSQDQWNSFYNLIICSVQTFFKFGLKFSTTNDDLAVRKLRQKIGEDFIDWASTYFDKTGNRNKRIDKKEAYDNYMENYPLQRRFCSIRKFKLKLKSFCDYSDLQFNPNAAEGPGKDIKSNGLEYVVISDENFNASNDE